MTLQVLVILKRMEVLTEGAAELVGFLSFDHFLTRNDFSDDLVLLVELDSDSKRSVGVVLPLQGALDKELGIQSTDLHEMQEFESEVIESVFDHGSAEAVGRGDLSLVENEVFVVLLVAKRTVESLSSFVKELKGLLGMDDDVVFHFGSFDKVDGFGELLTVGVLEESGVVHDSGCQLFNFFKFIENDV